uniref:FBA_2 domain-containing protein n=1 Tax=Caenorhabditis tropicalis TaxID=1561998 RepID=A0A1I7T4Q0_9PELO
MFPLLQLPSSCIQNVADQWKTIELYEFSFLSKRAKEVSKRKKVDDSKVIIDLNSRKIYFLKNGGNMRFEQNRFVVHQRQPSSLDTDIILFLQATQNFLNITNCRFETVYFNLKPPLTIDQLIMTIDWMNGLQNEIRKVVIFRATWQMFEIFINRFRKSINQLLAPYGGLKWDGIVQKRLKFEIKESFCSNPSQWFHLDFLFNMDTEQISAEKIDMSAQDLNVFLRSWQEGKTNRNLEKIDFVTCSKIDVKEVLKGCGGVLMDPRTTKVMAQKSGRYFLNDVWIRGGIHIRRNDGRLAVIQTSSYEYWKKGENAKKGHVEKYLKILEVWNSEDNSEKWMEKVFFIYII